MEFSRNRNVLSSFDIIVRLMKKFPDQNVKQIVDEYLKIRESHLIDGGTIKEPIGKSQITLRRVSSPKVFNVTQTSKRSVKVVTELNSRISTDLILKSLEDSEYSELLSNGRIKGNE